MGNLLQLRKVEDEEGENNVADNYWGKEATPSESPDIEIPEEEDLEDRFNTVLAAMDLPPDKAKVLKQYDNEKKWELICDKERMHAKASPSHYLQKLKTYLDPRASRSAKKRRFLGDATSTQVLRDLEISLRTNHIQWVYEFLNEENKGLDVLVDYLSYRQVVMRSEQRVQEGIQDSEEKLANGHARPSIVEHSTDSPKTIKRANRHQSKLNMGEAKNDVHVCIMCLRAIMNNKYGYNMVISHREAINCISLSLNHRSLRTKTLVLELLAAICLVKGSHEIILAAFDNFKMVMEETHRFQTLMSYFQNYEVFHVEFMVACMQFINIVVHAVEDMNFRVHLQYEFTTLGLDDYLDKLKHTESEELQVQISAYLDNMFDVQALMDDSITKSTALERVAEVEDDLARLQEQLQEVENDSTMKILDLENVLAVIVKERDDILEGKKQAEEEVSTLRKTVMQKEEESRKRQSLLESTIQELKKGGTISADFVMSTAPPPPPPPPPPLPSAAPPPPPPPPLPQTKTSAPAPPPPPPGNNVNGFMPPPPPPGLMPTPSNADALTIKRKVETKYKLPTLNWVALKPNQVRGTVFSELDDDKLFKVIDFGHFEEMFKIGLSGSSRAHADEEDGLVAYGSRRFKKPELTSLLEHNRLRNIAISRRKLDMPVETVIRAINNLDLQTLPTDCIELLQRMVPQDPEVKAYREYEKEKKNVSQLTEEDRFLLQLSKVERLSAKLKIMHYIACFSENILLIQPQVHSVIAASRAVKKSQKLHKVLEVILCFGNYMNSSKRGPAYGFKLQSLDNLLDTKSSDKKMTLLHYIVHTIKTKFSDLQNFHNELRYVEKAAGVSFENLGTDLHELEKGMELVKKEFELRRKIRDDKGQTLSDFLSQSEEKLKRLQTDMKTAQSNYSDTVEYFGESTRTLACNTFFTLLARFIKAYKNAEEENEMRQKAEEANNEEVMRRNKINSLKMQQEAVITELKNKTKNVGEKKILQQEDMYNGALEDILLGLKNEPYRRADAVRRSQKRKQENRLSRTMEELNL